MPFFALQSICFVLLLILKENTFFIKPEVLTIHELSSPTTWLQARVDFHTALLYDLLVVLGKISIQVKKKIRQIFWEVGNNITPRIIFNPPNRLRNSFSFKDKLPQNLDSVLFYKFTCDTWQLCLHWRNEASLASESLWALRSLDSDRKLAHLQWENWYCS